MRRPLVHIHYRRLPDRKDVYVQQLLLDRPDVKITFQPSTPIPRPVLVDGVSILDPGAPAVWFTFPGRWHDIGRFHRADGTFTGLYANVLTPCVLHPLDARSPTLRWDTTDLFLDVWMSPDGDVQILDEPDLASAVASGWISESHAGKARREADRIADQARRGGWPPAVVREWTLERALEQLGG